MWSYDDRVFRVRNKLESFSSCIEYKIANARNSMQPHNNYIIMKGNELQGLPELVTWHLV
jgi:hypothetical protein